MVSILFDTVHNASLDAVLSSIACLASWHWAGSLSTRHLLIYIEDIRLVLSNTAPGVIHILLYDLSILAGHRLCKGILASTGYAYGQILGLSLLFYEAQRSGVLPSTNRIAWRGDSAVTDVAPDGADVSGGWYDAGGRTAHL